MRPVSVSTVLYDGYPVEAALEAIADAGVRFVEPAFIAGYGDFDELGFAIPRAAELRRQIEAAGLTVCAVSAHTGIGAEDGARKLERRIAFAAELGARYVICNAGAEHDEPYIVENLTAVLPSLKAVGLVLALENPGHGAGALIPNAAVGSNFLERLGSESVRLNYDAGNTWTYSKGQLRPDSDLRRLDDSSRIAHLHVKDVEERQGDWSFCAVGRGVIDWPAVWRLLPPDLPISLELPLRLSRPGREDPVRAAKPMPLPALNAALRASLRFVDGLNEAEATLRRSAPPV